MKTLPQAICLILLLLLSACKGQSQNSSAKTNTKALADALQSHDTTAIKRLMEQCSLRTDNIVWGDMGTFMPLVFSIGFRLADVTSELLSRPDYALLNTTEGSRALERACQIRKKALVEQLIKQGADVNSLTEYGAPVFFGIIDDFGLVKLFVENGADINLSSKYSDLYTCSQATALHHAAVWSSIQIITYLIGKGAKINETDANGWTALHYAAYCGNTDAVAYLLAQGADKKAKTTRNWEIMTNMMQNPYPAGSTPLDIAMVSATNFSFNDKKPEFEKISFYLSTTRDADLAKIIDKIKDSLPAGWIIQSVPAFSNEFVIQSSLIELQPDLTSNDPFEVTGYCQIYVRMLPRLTPDSIFSIRKKNAYLLANLPPQNSKDNLQSWTMENQRILTALDNEPTHYDTQYSYRIDCRRIPKNEKEKAEYYRIISCIDAMFTKYADRGINDK